ncbi:hypothetical protein KN1_13360 [Stygiolobus caldivivus]|uniref:Uncharacterized protein n=1 Tax=Stygiolobus caldivivus TaxID=2824673 RepID=A0A8D5U661_9CREN|nr:hypothetical protein KN1_13360 [Stygiolobus caldivivus]
MFNKKINSLEELAEYLMDEFESDWLCLFWKRYYSYSIALSNMPERAGKG